MKAFGIFGLLMVPAFLLFLSYCSSPPDKRRGDPFYTLDDFTRVPKIDAHVHIRTFDTTFVHQAGEDNFRLLSIVVDEDPGITAQQEYAIRQKDAFPERVAFATAFSLRNFNSDHWVKHTVDDLQRSLDKGAIAVKIYKNIGMELKDRLGNMVMADNPKFNPLWDFLAGKNIPVIGHLGEPKNCWLPGDQMTIRSDKRYYARHPEFHMYLHPEYPSYEEQIKARDNMVAQHANLKFIGAHLGSLEWDTDELAKRLDRFPNMAVDMAARISHLQLQAVNDRKKVRDFFIRYQDRLIYGTDRIVDDTKSHQEVKTFVHHAWLDDWKFFCTADTMHSQAFDGVFNGLKLPKTVIDKIYYRNALNWFNNLKK